MIRDDPGQRWVWPHHGLTSQDGEKYHDDPDKHTDHLAELAKAIDGFRYAVTVLVSRNSPRALLADVGWCRCCCGCGHGWVYITKALLDANGGGWEAEPPCDVICGVRQIRRPRRFKEEPCDTLCIYTVRFEWDAGKNLRNQQKHDGLSFEVAVQVFADKFCFVSKDRIDEQTGEQRWHAVGRIGESAVYIVAYVYREENDDGEEIIRLISARQASKREIRRYFQQTAD